MPILTGKRLGPYEILSAIGAGGMGEVYRAKDTRLNRIVAVKVLPTHLADSPELRERFEREARTIASLNHAHICTLYDVGHQDGTDYLVMEYLEGETLAQRLVKGPLPLEQVLKYAIEIADALDKAHRKGVTHRDLKPGNIMLTKSGTKLLDFGLAKLKQEVAPANVQLSQLPTANDPLTAQGMIVGTLQYMAPEQLEGKEVDARTDIFAFGAVVYEMATGKKAFEGQSQASLIAAILEREPPPMFSLQPMTPPALDRVVKTCLAKDPDERWQNSHDLMSELKWIAESASQAAMCEPTAGRRRSLERLFGGIAAIALMVAAFALAFLYFRREAVDLPSGRFEVLPPAKSAIQMFKLSPDGRYLAFIASDAGANRLWIRPLDSLQAHVLPGTDGASGPFWSPDDNFIGFFAQGKLKRIALAGGPPQTLCDACGAGGANNSAAGTWNQEGTILFTPGMGSGIFRISSDGGIATPVTKPGGIDFPEFLPGGDRFLYFSRGGQGTSGIFAGSLDGRPSVRLLPDLSTVAYVPHPARGSGGYLLFRRGVALMAQPFNPDKLRSAGEMFPVAEPVGSVLSPADFSASANGVLAYRSAGETLGQRQFIWVDRAGKRLSLATDPIVSSFGTLSPDEKSIALVQNNSGGTSDIRLQNLARGVVSRFTFDTGIYRQPIWSPDGSHIAFDFEPQNQPGTFEFYQKPARGGQEELLLHAGLGARPYDWSPDGKWIVYGQFGEKTREDLWLLPLSGDRKPVVYLQTPATETQGQFSPDGQYMAYVSDESGQNEVYVQPIPINGTKWQVSSAGGSFPRWRRDGKELFFVTADLKLMSVPVKVSSSFEFASPQALFAIQPVPALVRFPYQPAADGRQFLVNAPAGDEATPITVVLNWTSSLKK
jgi:serine/threonine protein kinase